MVEYEDMCLFLFKHDDWALHCAQNYCQSWVTARSIALMVVIGILLFQMLVLSGRHYFLKRSLGMKSNAMIIAEKMKEAADEDEEENNKNKGL